MAEQPDTSSSSSPAAPGGAQDETVHHESRRKKEGLPPVQMQLNLTSMIDVIFQLLIYFVVTASFAINEGVIIANLPEQGGAQQADVEPPDRPINIVIISDGMAGYRLRFENQPRTPANFNELKEILIQIQNNPKLGRSGVYATDNPVIIKPDGRVRWQHVVNAFNAAVSARYEQISFAAAQ